MFEIIYTHNAEKQLSKLPDDVRRRIVKSLERIRITPGKYVEKLVGEEGYKFRVGDYRVILDIINADLVILVIKVGHRKNVYDFQR